MVEVKIRENETVGSLVRRFKRLSQFKKSKFKEKEYFIKPAKRRDLKASRKSTF